MSKLWLTNFLSILPLHKQWSFPLRIWSHLLNKSLMQNFNFCALILVFWNLPLFSSNYRRTREGIEQKGNTGAIAKLKTKLFSSNFQPSKTKSYSKPVPSTDHLRHSFQGFLLYLTLSLREECPNSEFTLARIFPLSEEIQIQTLFREHISINLFSNLIDLDYVLLSFLSSRWFG